MFRGILDEIVETIGPFAVTVLAAVACIAVFAPLLFAFLAPVLG